MAVCFVEVEELVWNGIVPGCGLSKAAVGPELCLPDAAPNNHGTWDYQRR